MSFATSAIFIVDHTKVNTGNQTNFPVVISGTYSWAAATGSGGNSLNANGYDLRPYSDSGLTSAYTYQLRSYNSTTGAFNMVVLIPTLSASVDTNIYLGIGDAALNTDGSSTSVWDANFKAVYGFGDGTTLVLTDNTSNGNTLTNNNTATATPGNAGGMGAVSFNGSTQSLTRTAGIVTTEPMTIEALYNPPDNTLSGALVGEGANAAGTGLRELGKRLTNVLRAGMVGATTSGNADSSSAYIVSSWNYGAATFTSQSSHDSHANGAAKANNATNCGTMTAADRFTVGARNQAGSINNFFTGKIGEVRVSNVVRSDSWIKTTDANLRGISTFYSVTAPSATSLSFTQQPSTVASGAANSPSVTVQLSDNASGVTVTMALNTGLGTLSGTLTAVSNGSGLATFSNLIVTGGGAHTLTATATSYTSATSSSFTVTNTIMAANQTFITANGGDSAWLGVMDYRVNIPDDGSGKALQLNEVRGAGVTSTFPATQATQSKRYTIGGSGLVGTAAALSHYITALDTRIDLSQNAAFTIYAVVKSPSGSSFLVGVSPDPTDTTSRPYAYLATNASDYGAQINPTAAGVTNQVTLDSLTTFDSTLRLVNVSKERTNIVSTAPGTIAYSTKVDGRESTYRLIVSAADAASLALCIGRFGGTYADLTILWIGITNQDRTAALDLAVATFTGTQFSTSPDLSKRGTFTYSGTSTNRAHNTTHPVDNAGDTAANTGTTLDFYVCATTATGFGTFASHSLEDDVNKVCIAHNGSAPSDHVITFPYREALQIDTRRGGGHLYLTGTALSDIVSNPGVGGATTAQNSIISLVSLANAAGYSVIGETINDYSVWYTAGALNQAGTNAMAVNTWLRGTFLGLTGVVGLIDYEADSGNHFCINRIVRGLGGTLSYTDTTYFDGTGHPTDVGHALRGSIMRAWFEANSTVLAFPAAGTPSLRRHRRAATVRRRR